ncbi:MAG: hypothetical protein ACMUIM_01695 [bacterium]
MMQQLPPNTNAIITLVLVTLLLAYLPYIVYADAPSKIKGQFHRIIESPEDNLLVLRVLLGRIILTEGIIGYQYKENVLLPLGEFSQALEFPIIIDPEKGIATGWFMRESKTFTLDLNKGVVAISGKEYQLRPGTAELGNNDIFVNIKTLEKWFPILLEFIQKRMIINVTSTEPLPIEERLEREKRRGSLNKKNNFETEKYRRVQSPYKLVQIPFMNLTNNTRYDNNQKEDHENSTTFLMTGDLLYLNSTILIAADSDEGLSNFRLSMGRKDLEGRLLGPLKATEFSLGDVYTPQIPGTTISQSGRGVSLSNFPLEYASDFDTITIRGDIEPDWEVELYRNDVLLDFQHAGEDLIYEFTDIPLLAGLNNIKLIFYGPFNQKREKIHRFLMHPDLLKKGRFYYRFSANQHETDLIPIGDDTIKTGQKQGKGRYIAEFEYGVGKRTTIISNLAAIPLDDGHQNNYCSIGGLSSFGGIYGRFEVTERLNDEKGRASHTSVQTRLGGYSIIAKYDQFSHNFISEKRTRSAYSLSDSLHLRLDGSLRMKFLPSLNIGLTGKRDHFESGQTNIDISNRISLFVKRFHISHNLYYALRNKGTIDGPIEQLDGRLLVNLHLHKLSLRGDIGYNIDPDKNIMDGTITSDYRLTKNFSFRAGISHKFQGEKTYGYSTGLSKTFSRFILGLSTTYEDNGHYSIRLSASMGIGYEPIKKKGVISSQSLGNAGIVSARVFLDENQDGQFDDQDILLPDVKFHINNSPSKIKTNEHGIALLTNISSYTPVTITVDRSSFDDPYWIAKEDTIEVIARPGAPIQLDFPILETGEIDGIVYIKKDNEIREASNVELELIDQKGTIIKKTKSVYDGFYLFDLVPMGSYLVRISEEQLKRLKLKNVKAQSITVTRENAIVSGTEFIIEPLEDMEKGADYPAGAEGGGS